MVRRIGQTLLLNHVGGGSCAPLLRVSTCAWRARKRYVVIEVSDPGIHLRVEGATACT